MSRADKLTTFVYRLSWNLGASPSWNHQGLSRPVCGLLCLYLCGLPQPIFNRWRSFFFWTSRRVEKLP